MNFLLNHTNKKFYKLNELASSDCTIHIYTLPNLLSCYYITCANRTIFKLGSNFKLFMICIIFKTLISTKVKGVNGNSSCMMKIAVVFFWESQKKRNFFPSNIRDKRQALSHGNGDIK